MILVLITQLYTSIAEQRCVESTRKHKICESKQKNDCVESLDIPKFTFLSISLIYKRL